MPLQIHKLSVLAYDRRFTLFHYETEVDRLDEVAADGYFDEALGFFHPGDRIMITAINGSRDLVVASLKNGGVVVERLS